MSIHLFILVAVSQYDYFTMAKQTALMASMAAKDRVKEVFFNIMKKDWFFHGLFWLSLYVILIVLDRSQNLQYVLVKELVNVLFFALMVYINLYYLFPQYLAKKNLLIHLASLAVTALLITPIKTTAFYISSSSYADVQSYFLNNQPSIFLSTFFIGIASTIYNIMNDWLLSQREKKELQAQTLQSELKFLKSQINPHFLFNTLNSLYALTLKKSDQAPEIVLKLSEMMRYMLYECNVPMVPLQKEVNYLKNYLELEKLRQGKKMKISLDVVGEPRHQRIAPLMFIPFVENCFKHGISNQITEGFVDISMEISTESVTVHIQNSKAPTRPSNSGKKSGGIGLVNVRRRLKLLYPDKHNLSISEDPNTYHVTLTLQLH